MALINTNVVISSVTPQQQVLQFRGQLNMSFAQMVKLFTQIKSFIWNNIDGLTPQQAIDLFGKDAADLFMLSNAYCMMLETYTGQPQKVMPEGWSFIFNEDGTVTVNQNS